MKKYGEYRFAEKLKSLKGPLRKWNSEVFGDIDHTISKLEEELAVVDRSLDNEGNDEVSLARWEALISLLNRQYNRKGEFWKQLSREKFIKEVDKNTKYFHLLANMKRRNKHIFELLVGGRSIHNPRRIKQEIRGYFKKLYQQKQLPFIKVQEGLLNQISQDQASVIEVIPYEEEIKVAVWLCDPSKALGSDGFNLNFVKKMRNVIEVDFQQLVLHFSISGALPKKLNVTWVSLIPKFEGAKDIKDLRPISMVGCVYKVIAKILANRMKNVMDVLVGEVQSTFVKGRQILDGALIAYETVFQLKKKKKEGMLVKLDFRKAYDSVRWSFVDHVLESMGFGVIW